MLKTLDALPSIAWLATWLAALVSPSPKTSLVSPLMHLHLFPSTKQQISAPLQTRISFHTAPTHWIQPRTTSSPNMRSIWPARCRTLTTQAGVTVAAQTAKTRREMNLSRCPTENCGATGWSGGQGLAVPLNALGFATSGTLHACQLVNSHPTDEALLTNSTPTRKHRKIHNPKIKCEVPGCTIRPNKFAESKGLYRHYAIHHEGTPWANDPRAQAVKVVCQIDGCTYKGRKDNVEGRHRQTHHPNR